MQVMLIDDEKDCMESLAAALEPTGYRTETFSSPIEALSAYAKEKYDVVITDMRMPLMTGTQVLRILRRMNPSARVILLTGYADDETVAASLQDGAFAFLTKPVDIAELLEVLNKAENQSDPKAPAQSVKECKDSPASGPIAAEIPTGLTLSITPEFLKHFVDEAADIFEEAEGVLLLMEEHPDDLGLVEQVFRAFHSFKGNAGFFGFANFEKLSHKAETLLESIREGQKAVTPALISVLLSVVDALRAGMLQAVQGKGDPIQELTRVLYSLEQLEMPAKTDDTGGRGFDASRFIAADPGPKTANTTPSSAAQSALRVDVEKMDQLMDLVGEMVISVSMVSNSPDLQGLQLDRFEKSVLQLTKITRDIQDVSMSMRMIPLTGTCRKMVRLVRDVALKENKKVDIEIIGAETEVDKAIIEQLTDPLVHLMRNAVCHGIESPSDRLTAGKPEVGRITLEARHSAGEVFIMIKDDGYGIRRDVLLQKAVESGLVKEEAYGWKDEDVFKLIFESGLSTTPQVSSLSGRGVGMDVVKQNVEKLRGRIDIKSSPGAGTVFILRIPLTLAIIDGMIVQVGSVKYAIPLTFIQESLRPEAGRIVVTPEGLELLNVRHQLLPVIRLHEVYKVGKARTKLTEGILVVVEHDMKKYCLFVDELVGQQQIVIKGLPEYFARIRGVSGFAILGDGEVSTILDIAGLVGSMEGLLADT